MPRKKKVEVNKPLDEVTEAKEIRKLRAEQFNLNVCPICFRTPSILLKTGKAICQESNANCPLSNN